MRKASLERKTKETQISINLNLDGNGKSAVSTGIGFFDHINILHFSSKDLSTF